MPFGRQNNQLRSTVQRRRDALHIPAGDQMLHELRRSLLRYAECAWRLTVPPQLSGAAHRPSREEVLLILSGQLCVTLDGDTRMLEAGAVIHVPAEPLLQIDGGAHGGSAWVTTTPGLTASKLDGTAITPGWTRDQRTR